MSDEPHQPTEPMPEPPTADTKPDSGQTLLEIGQASIYADPELAATLIEQAPTQPLTNASQAETRRVALPAGGLGGRRYEIRNELGRGGMGIVMKAFDRDLQREVALKITRGDHSGPMAIARFVSEAQVTGQLSHPNVVPVHELGHEGGGRTWFTMKLVEGRSMAKVISALRAGDEKTRADYPLHRRLYVFTQLLNGMAYAHDRGVIHRDLKPDNIMLGDFGEVLVMDWGLAKVRNRPELAGKVTTSRLSTPGSETLDGTIVGTPAYMPPEQARGEADKIDERSDIYSLGAILYELLCLKPPYEAETATELLRQVVTTPPVRPSRRNADVVLPRGLEDICMKCLAPEQDARFQTVRDLQKALQAYEQTVEETAGEGTVFSLLGKFYVLCTAACIFLLTAWVASGPEKLSFRSHLLYPGMLSTLMTFGFGALLEWTRLGPRWAYDATDAVLFWKKGNVGSDGLRGFFAVEACRRAKWVYLLPCVGAVAYSAIMQSPQAMLIAGQMFLADIMCSMGVAAVEQGSYRRLDALHEVAAQDRRDAPFRWIVVIAVMGLAVLYMAEAGWDVRARSLNEQYARGILILHLVAVFIGVWALAVVSHPVREVNRALKLLLFSRIKPEQREHLAPMARQMASNAVFFGVIGALTWIDLHAPTVGRPDGAIASHFAMGLTALWAGLMWSWLFRWRARVVNVLKPHETQMQQRFEAYRKTRQPKAEGFAAYVATWSPFLLGGLLSLAWLMWRTFG